MRILLPQHFKLIGLVIAPLGLATWLGCQLGYFDIFLGPWPENLPLRRALLVPGGFSFLFGMYFIAFSKEKFEDEMIKRIRLESFLFAAYIQMAIVIAFFLFVLFAGDLKQGGFELFLIGTIVLFWMAYVIRFNYTLHFNYGKWTTE